MGSSLLIIFVRLGLPTLILRVFFPQILSIRGRPCGSPGNTWMTTSSTWTGSSSWTTRSTCLEAAKNSMSWVRKRGPSADFKQRLQGLYFFWGRWLLLKTRPFVKAVKRVGFHTKDRASSSLAEQRTPGLKGNSSLRNVLPSLWVEPSSLELFFYSMMIFVSWITWIRIRIFIGRWHHHFFLVQHFWSPSASIWHCQDPTDPTELRETFSCLATHWLG